MFNWFKKKIKLKNDKSIMVSIYQNKGIKIGTEIIVPNNFELLVSYKGKIYATLREGQHTFDKSTIGELISKFDKSHKKQKCIKCVLHYITTSNQTLKITKKKRMFSIHFNISNAQKFANLMLLYTFKVDSQYAIEYLTEIFEELLKSNQYMIDKTPKDALEQYGITIYRINNISSINSNKKTLTPVEQNSSTTPQSSLSQISNHDTHQSNIDSEISELAKSYTGPCGTSSCPKCNYPIRFATKYCLKCGADLEKH